ncbi:MAG: NADH-quinone oxidoreductase subunit M [bacterium]|nr:NADH-quinone oxidoreductase subunit M [bacterium]
MLTILLLLIPLITAILLVVAGNKSARAIALSGALLELILAFVSMLLMQQGNSAHLFTVHYNWITSLGISFSFTIDGISMLMVLLSSLLLPIIVYSSFNKTYHNAHIMYALMMLMMSAMIGVFTAADGFLFYIMWELSLIPIYFIILVWGGENRQKITFKFFLYTLFGSLFMLLALIYVYLQMPEASRSFDIQALYQAGRLLSVEEQGLILAAFFLAFAVKMPIIPFHSWQPKTYYTAPTPGVMMLSGIMAKMATYGLIRWVLPMVPDGLAEYGNYGITLSVISIIYASCISIVQKDFKYLIAYASIAHIGLISAGIFAGNIQSIQGSLIEMLSHGINTVGLFIAYDIIYKRTGTSEMSKLGGIRAIDSSFAFMFFIVILSVVALPFTTGFVGEFLLILGLFTSNPIAGSVAGLSIILGVVYMFRSFQKMMLGESSAHILSLPKLDRQEKTSLTIIVILIIGLGVYPKPILDITENAVTTLLEGIK